MCQHIVCNGIRHFLGPINISEGLCPRNIMMDCVFAEPVIVV